MAYEPTIWKDRVVEKPRTFNIVNNPDGTVTLVPAPGVVVEEGTPVNAANLNKLEQGLKMHEAESATDAHLPKNVGLGNVQNYGIATQAEAEEGTVNNKYMTPLRTEQLIKDFLNRPPMYTPGDNVVMSSSTRLTVTSKTGSIRVERELEFGGHLRIVFRAGKPGGWAGTFKGEYAIYRNGSRVGLLRSFSSNSSVTYTEDIDGWEAGDKFQIWAKYISGGDIGDEEDYRYVTIESWSIRVAEKIT